MAEAIKVTLRFRGFEKSEEMGFADWRFEGDDTIALDEKTNTYDSVLGPECDQAEMYQRFARETMIQFMNGYNGTIFAYG